MINSLDFLPLNFYNRVNEIIARSIPEKGIYGHHREIQDTRSRHTFIQMNFNFLHQKFRLFSVGNTICL